MYSGNILVNEITVNLMHLTIYLYNLVLLECLLLADL